MRDARPQAARDEREMRIGVAGFHRALLGIEVAAAVQAVVLVARVLGKERAKRLQIARHRFRGQSRRQAAVEKAGGCVRRPIEAVWIGCECLVFGGKMGAELDDVESRLGNKFEREIERLRGRASLRHAKVYSRVTQVTQRS